MKTEISILVGTVLLLVLFGCISFAFAGFNYGVDSYSTVGNQLIVNSMGDQSTVSTYGNLGTNDWISENAVKNYLGMEGYTYANDYNPPLQIHNLQVNITHYHYQILRNCSLQDY